MSQYRVSKSYNRGSLRLQKFGHAKMRHIIEVVVLSSVILKRLDCSGIIIFSYEFTKGVVT